MSRPHLRDPKLEQLWRTRLARWVKSGLNVRDFCRRYQLAETAFYFWRRVIAARDRTPPASVPPTSSPLARRTSASHRRPSRRTPAPPPRPTFVPVRVIADAPLELVLRSGHVLRVPPGYDAGHLRAVVAALEADPC